MAKQLRRASAARRVAGLLGTPTRYAKIGLVCALLSNAIIIGFDQLGIHYLLSAIVATAVATIVGFLLHSAYTFRTPPSFRAFLRFVGGTALGSSLAILLMILFCDGLGLSASAAIPIATIILFAWNFILAHWAIRGSARLKSQQAERFGEIT